jgi:small subunit ribosomal protein S8
MASAKTVMIKRSRLCLNVAKVLRDEGYISEVIEVDDGKQGLIRVTLKYGPNGEKVIQNLRRESKPGCRVYRSVGEIPKVLEGLGMAIVSTSKGVMSDREARKQNIGGELICTVY